VTTSPSGLAYSLTGAPDTNAGSYPVTAAVTNPNYTGSATGTFIISPATATVTLGNLTQAYTGGALSPSVTTSPSGLAYSLTGAPDTNAGSYPVTATVTDPNYTGSATGTFVINPATATVTLGNLTQTYTGSGLSPSVTTSPSGLAYSLTGAPDTNAGPYQVTATVTNPNYTGSATGTFTISPATATVTLGNLTQTYTGSALSPSVTTVPSGLTYSLSGAPGTNAGPYQVTATVTNPNYTGSATGTFTISPATATVTLGNLTQTYTGSALSPSVTTTPSGLAYSLSGAPDTNAGSYPVTATVTNPNYAGSASGTFIINPATATVTLGNLTQTYTGGALSPSVTTSPSGLAYSLTGAPDINAGSYPVTATVTNPNYTGSASGMFTIGPATATVALGNLTQTYTGSALSPSVTTTPGGLAYSLTGAPDINAGSYPVTAMVTNPNYTGPANGTFTIAPASAAISLSNLVQTYTGSPISATATTAPPVCGPVALTYNGSSTPPTNAGNYAVVASIVNPNCSGPNATGALIILTTPVSSGVSFKMQSTAAGNILWFNSVFKLNGSTPTPGSHLYVTGGTISFGTTAVTVPNAVITFAPAGTPATTTFDGTEWNTTVPYDFGDNIFLAGVAYTLPASIDNNTATTWTEQFASDDPGLQENWQGAAAAYSTFGSYNSIGVKVLHSNSGDSYPNGNQAGTPENFKSYLVSGGTGGGGSNYGRL